MKLNQISDNDGAKSARKRVGRGIGSGLGKTGGRGHKGQKSRSGVALKGTEGGQMPLHRRLPKRGFKNIFKKSYAEINLGALQVAIDSGKLDAAQTIDAAALAGAGLIRSGKQEVSLLARGTLTAKVEIVVARASKAAAAAIEKAGGTLTSTAASKKADEKAGEKAGKGEKT
jgi:large subunit ribosomal protein L15